MLRVTWGREGDARRCAQRCMNNILDFYAEWQVDPEYQNHDEADLMCRQEELASEYQEFKRAHNEMCEEMQERAGNEERQQSKKARGAYLQVHAALTRAIKRQETPVAPDLLNTTLGGSVIRVETARLPEPGEFDGNPCNWPAFRDRFLAEVHNKEHLDAVSKFVYLRKACIKSAASILDDWPLTADNYKLAWKSLERRFSDNYQLQHSLMLELLEMPKAKEESYSTLRHLLDTVNKIIRKAEAMKLPFNDGENAMLRSLVVSRLPKSTADSWEQRRSVDKVPSLNELLDFIDGKARGRMFTDSAEGHSSGGDQERKRDRFEHRGRQENGRFVRKFINYNHHDRSPFRNSSVKVERKEDGVKHGERPAGGSRGCYYCGQSHWLHQCEAFLKLAIGKRIAEVKSWKACIVCFRKHEGACKRPNCFKCGGSHNTLLCLKGANKLAVVNGIQNENQTSQKGKRSY